MNEEDSKIKEMFDFIDKNNTNSISYKDLEFAFIGLGSSLSIKEINELIGNKPSRLKYDEFLSLCKNNIDVFQLDQQLIQALKLLEDPNRPGYIPISSLRSLLIYNKYSDKEIDLIIKEGSPTDDGYINCHSFASELLK